ncbi:GNAT family N-acetyltransferase [Streptomyces sp. IB2014 016-6]|uniref:GNAT family N-acetyltransferase n=1 Tax=Streptomyces sp. IB2014 016-6 TaxID=2517818 RepID=UPI0011CBAC67|nr:GNAT family N-acetyltransferase [Streptomyces sp. IB2014 016-6]TXL92114.1 GNAT family N-acetyltransferase [Streptomyces sp. IB2014 016-6]
MNPARVRPFERDDLPGAATALLKVHETDGYPVEGVEDPEAWVSSDDVLAAWVAEMDGEVVGHVAVMRPHGEAAVSLWIEQSGDDEARVAVLGRLLVVQAARKHATGRRLTEVAMSYGRDRDLRLVLDVMTKDTAAMRLYERLGWLRIGETAHHFGNGESIPAVCYVAPDA